MKRLLVITMCAIACVAHPHPSPVCAQVPVPPNPPTLWSFLGITQGMRKVNGALFNRRGNLPGMEPKIPLKALNDPRNLVSDNPAIKKAAEVKTAEDLKKQKIKAIKYLAKIGCGCYDKDGEITKALIAASEDCTEPVRLAAMEAVKEAADGGCCANCSQTCCCNEDMVKQLAKIAYERKDDGCYFEPSERVRLAAKDALCTCCPNQLSDFEIEMAPEEIAPPSKEEPAEEQPEQLKPIPDEDPSPAAEAQVAPGQNTVEHEIAEATAALLPSEAETSTLRQPVRNVVTEEIEGQLEGQLVEESVELTTDERETDRVSMAPHDPPAPVRLQRLTQITPEQLAGTVVATENSRGLAHIHLQTPASLAPGTQLSIYQMRDGVPSWVGDVEVYELVASSANVRAVGTTDVAVIRPGDLVIVPPADETTGSEMTVETENQPSHPLRHQRTLVQPVHFDTRTITR